MQVISLAECSMGSILQYFQPALSYYLSLRSLFCLFLSDPLRQVLLYIDQHNVATQQVTVYFYKEVFIYMYATFLYPPPPPPPPANFVCGGYTQCCHGQGKSSGK